MSDIERATRAGSGPVPRKQAREHQLAVERLALGTKLTATEVDAEAALTGRIMERVVDIDSYRRALAAGDETLNAVLTRIELGFIAKAERIQRNFGSEFGL